MLSGNLEKLFPFRFKLLKEDKQAKSCGRVLLVKLQFARLRFTNELQSDDRESLKGSEVISFFTVHDRKIEPNDLVSPFFDCGWKIDVPSAWKTVKYSNF
jgi:hypothetical protein